MFCSVKVFRFSCLLLSAEAKLIPALYNHPVVCVLSITLCLLSVFLFIVGEVIRLAKILTPPTSKKTVVFPRLLEEVRHARQRDAGTCSVLAYHCVTEAEDFSREHIRSKGTSLLFSHVLFKEIALNITCFLPSTKKQ